ncbi:MAG: hypothetical protein LBP59_20195 [Planctomycetaceae bacterium]|jgi:23S rRNA (cytosine1962-C5)-methyltransferase|nr:hypothetical protein [Planctomycetaceae bacterium]
MSGYELLDFGDGYCLERFGRYVLCRPSLSACGFCRSDVLLWERVDSLFVPEPVKGRRGVWTVSLDTWQIDLGQVMLELRCTPFGHVGFFAEQYLNWLELSGVISAELFRRDVIKVLNLFAYTGGASIAAAKTPLNTTSSSTPLSTLSKLSTTSTLSTSSSATKITTATPQLSTSSINPTIEFGNSGKRVEVTHVDSAGNIVEWAKRNVALSGVSGVRFIVEDVRKFVMRELRRGNFYDVIIIDPPTYGHGVKGESWRFAVDLPVLLADIAGLLSEQPALIMLTAHTEGFDPDFLQNILLKARIPKSLKLKKFQMQIKTKTGKSLPAGYGISASIYNS